MKQLWLILFVSWTLLIVILSAIPVSRELSSSGDSLIRLDYIEHFMAYFAFAGFYILWRSNRDMMMNRLELVLMLPAVIAFSILTEAMQLFIPGRAFNPVDAAYNLAGAIFSILIVYFYLIRTLLRKKIIQAR